MIQAYFITANNVKKVKTFRVFGLAFKWLNEQHRRHKKEGQGGINYLPIM